MISGCELAELADWELFSHCIIVCIEYRESIVVAKNRYSDFSLDSVSNKLMSVCLSTLKKKSTLSTSTKFNLHQTYHICLYKFT